MTRRRLGGMERGRGGRKRTRGGKTRKSSPASGVMAGGGLSRAEDAEVDVAGRLLSEDAQLGGCSTERNKKRQIV